MNERVCVYSPVSTGGTAFDIRSWANKNTDMLQRKLLEADIALNDIGVIEKNSGWGLRGSGGELLVAVENYRPGGGFLSLWRQKITDHGGEKLPSTAAGRIKRDVAWLTLLQDTITR